MARRLGQWRAVTSGVGQTGLSDRHFGPHSTQTASRIRLSRFAPTPVAPFCNFLLSTRSTTCGRFCRIPFGGVDKDVDADVRE